MPARESVVPLPHAISAAYVSLGPAGSVKASVTGALALPPVSRMGEDGTVSPPAGMVGAMFAMVAVVVLLSVPPLPSETDSLTMYASLSAYVWLAGGVRPEPVVPSPRSHE